MFFLLPLVGVAVGATVGALVTHASSENDKQAGKHHRLVANDLTNKFSNLEKRYNEYVDNSKSQIDDLTRQHALDEVEKDFLRIAIRLQQSLYMLMLNIDDKPTYDVLIDFEKAVAATNEILSELNEEPIQISNKYFSRNLTRVNRCDQAEIKKLAKSNKKKMGVADRWYEPTDESLENPSNVLQIHTAIQQRQKIEPEHEIIQKRIQQIELLADPLSKRYGHLLNWQNSSDPVWHYGIGLSDTYIFDTGQGLRPFKRKNAKCVVGINDIAFEPQQTIERLKYALRVFGGWKYTFLGWNSEHLGRLIATDQPRCYRSNPIWWMCDLTSEGEHKTARKIFQDYLEKADPRLNR